MPITFSEGIALKRTPTAVDYTTADEDIIGVTNTAAPRTITLASADCVPGKIFIIKDESGGAGTNNITIDTQGGKTIDGALSVSITVDFGSVRIYSDGVNWETH